MVLSKSGSWRIAPFNPDTMSTKICVVLISGLCAEMAKLALPRKEVSLITISSKSKSKDSLIYEKPGKTASKAVIKPPSKSAQ